MFNKEFSWVLFEKKNKLVTFIQYECEWGASSRLKTILTRHHGSGSLTAVHEKTLSLDYVFQVSVSYWSLALIFSYIKMALCSNWIVIPIIYIILTSTLSIPRFSGRSKMLQAL